MPNIEDIDLGRLSDDNSLKNKKNTIDLINIVTSIDFSKIMPGIVINPEVERLLQKRLSEIKSKFPQASELELYISYLQERFPGADNILSFFARFKDNQHAISLVKEFAHIAASYSEDSEEIKKLNDLILMKYFDQCFDGAVENLELLIYETSGGFDGFLLKFLFQVIDFYISKFLNDHKLSRGSVFEIHDFDYLRRMACQELKIPIRDSIEKKFDYKSFPQEKIKLFLDGLKREVGAKSFNNFIQEQDMLTLIKNCSKEKVTLFQGFNLEDKCILDLLSSKPCIRYSSDNQIINFSDSNGILTPLYSLSDLDNTTINLDLVPLLNEENIFLNYARVERFRKKVFKRYALDDSYLFFFENLFRDPLHGIMESETEKLIKIFFIHVLINKGIITVTEDFELQLNKLQQAFLAQELKDDARKVFYYFDLYGHYLYKLSTHNHYTHPLEQELEYLSKNPELLKEISGFHDELQNSLSLRKRDLFLLKKAEEYLTGNQDYFTFTLDLSEQEKIRVTQFILKFELKKANFSEKTLSLSDMSKNLLSSLFEEMSSKQRVQSVLPFLSQEIQSDFINQKILSKLDISSPEIKTTLWSFIYEHGSFSLLKKFFLNQPQEVLTILEKEVEHIKEDPDSFSFIIPYLLENQLEIQEEKKIIESEIGKKIYFIFLETDLGNDSGQSRILDYLNQYSLDFIFEIFVQNIYNSHTNNLELILDYLIQLSSNPLQSDQVEELTNFYLSYSSFFYLDSIKSDNENFNLLREKFHLCRFDKLQTMEHYLEHFNHFCLSALSIKSLNLLYKIFMKFQDFLEKKKTYLDYIWPTQYDAEELFHEETFDQMMDFLIESLTTHYDAIERDSKSHVSRENIFFTESVLFIILKKHFFEFERYLDTHKELVQLANFKRSISLREFFNLKVQSEISKLNDLPELDRVKNSILVDNLEKNLIRAEDFKKECLDLKIDLITFYSLLEGKLLITNFEELKIFLELSFTIFKDFNSSDYHINDSEIKNSIFLKLAMSAQNFYQNLESIENNFLQSTYTESSPTPQLILSSTNSVDNRGKVQKSNFQISQQKQEIRQVLLRIVENLTLLEASSLPMILIAYDNSSESEIEYLKSKEFKIKTISNDFVEFLKKAYLKDNLTLISVVLEKTFLTEGVDRNLFGTLLSKEVLEKLFPNDSLQEGLRSEKLLSLFASIMKKGNYTLKSIEQLDENSFEFQARSKLLIEYIKKVGPDEEEFDIKSLFDKFNLISFDTLAFRAEEVSHSLLTREKALSTKIFASVLSSQNDEVLDDLKSLFKNKKILISFIKYADIESLERLWDKFDIKLTTEEQLGSEKYFDGNFSFATNYFNYVYNDSEKVDFLLSKELSLNGKEISEDRVINFYPLELAIKSQNIDTIHFLLDRGAFRGYTDDYGEVNVEETYQEYSKIESSKLFDENTFKKLLRDNIEKSKINDNARKIKPK